MLGAGSKVVCGRDTRRSGAMIRAAVTSGLTAGGVNVVDLGVVSTPGASLMVARLGADGGVVITASHNPPAYNGIKLLQSSGSGLTSEQAGRLKEIWLAKDFRLVGVDELGSEGFDGSTHQRHVEAVCGICDVEAVRSKAFRIVVDSINGAGCTVTPMLAERLGCHLVHVNATPDGRFAHEPEPIEQNLRSLCDAVREHSAAVGFAQDPDADRLVVVDENGTFIGEEYTLALAARHVLRSRKGKLATNLATSRMIDDVAAEAGVEVVRAPTGEANVVETMRREGCIFGGEGNGGVIDPRVAPIRNSLVGIAMILQELAETGKTVGELVAEIPSYVMVKTKMPCPAGSAEQVAARTRGLFAATREARFNDVDGLRVDLPEGWVCIRGSNTEPILRIFAEAPERRAAEELVAKVRAVADEVVGG
jgi:phosphomannomutase